MAKRTKTSGRRRKPKQEFEPQVPSGDNFAGEVEEAQSNFMREQAELDKQSILDDIVEKGLKDSTEDAGELAAWLKAGTRTKDSREKAHCLRRAADVAGRMREVARDFLRRAKVNLSDDEPATAALAQQLDAVREELAYTKEELAKTREPMLAAAEASS